MANETYGALDWPNELERTDPDDREKTAKFDVKFTRTRRALEKSMEQMGVDQWRLSHDSGSGGDPGIVVRWSEAEVPHAVACDWYKTKKSNAREVYLWIEETRKRGGREVVTGDTDFAAARLMPPGGADADPSKPPHEVLEISPDASDAVVDAAKRAKLKTAHPDQGGSAEEKQRVMQAAEAMLDDGE